MKLNTNGSVIGETGPVGADGVLKDALGNWVFHAPNPRLGGRRGARLYWDSLPAFSNIGMPKSYN